MAQDQIFFQQQLPQYVRDVANYEPFVKPFIDNKQAADTMRHMRTKVLELCEKGPGILLMNLYMPYAKEHGLMETKEVFEVSLNLPIAIDKLSPDDLRNWKNHLVFESPSRDLIVKATGEVLGLLTLPDVRYVFVQEVQDVHKRLMQTKYQIALKLLPDITDDEAKKLFGQLTLAGDVHRLAAEELV